jgi:hypothetical protein
MAPREPEHPSNPVPTGETQHGGEPVVLRQWIETEATARVRAEREARRHNVSDSDRVAHYVRGPTAFSA